MQKTSRTRITQSAAFRHVVVDSNEAVMRSRASHYPVAFFPDGIGDHLHCLPSLRALAMMFAPRLMLIGRSKYRQVFFPDLPLRGYCELQEDDVAKMVADIGPCDLFLSLDPDPESPMIESLVTGLSNPFSIGWSRRADATLAVDEYRHFSDQVFDVPTILGTDKRLEELAYPPRLPEVALHSARRIRSQVAHSLRILAVHGETHPAKMWPSNRFEQVIDMFLDRHPDFLVFEIGQVNMKLRNVRHIDQVVPCHGLPLATSLALTSMADLFLGVDSCMVHAADFFDVPAVGLFSDCQLSRRWGCRFGRHIHVCGTGSMNSIPDVLVIDALEKLLDS